MASAWPPPGSSICQTIPNAVRSIVVSSESESFSMPSPNETGPADAAGGLDRERDAGHRELAGDGEVVGGAADRGRAEA